MTNEKITIIAETFESAALEFHRRNLSEQGYRLASPISTSRLEKIDDKDRDVMFDGKPMYLVTFVKNH